MLEAIKAIIARDLNMNVCDPLLFNATVTKGDSE
jgi:hypothetical protein